MPLDPQARIFLEKMGAGRAPGFETMPLPLARASFVLLCGLAGHPEPIARVESVSLPGNVGARVYTPEGDGPWPGLLFFHGGGWVLGNLDTGEVPCRRLANAARCVVVSVGYRLAPEHKFPIPVEDCYAATRYVAEHAARFRIDPARLAVGGDSAGGNLAAAVTLLARDRGGPALSFQLLLYPVTDSSCETASYADFARGYGLTRKTMHYFWSRYLPHPEDGLNPLASPMRAADLAGLPPALVVTAEFDPLRDEGEAYAARLRQAGVAAETRRAPGMIHGFLHMGSVIDQARSVTLDCAATLRKVWEP